MTGTPTHPCLAGLSARGTADRHPSPRSCAALCKPHPRSSARQEGARGDSDAGRTARRVSTLRPRCRRRPRAMPGTRATRSVRPRTIARRCRECSGRRAALRGAVVCRPGGCPYRPRPRDIAHRVRSAHRGPRRPRTRGRHDHSVRRRGNAGRGGRARRALLAAHRECTPPRVRSDRPCCRSSAGSRKGRPGRAGDRRPRGTSVPHHRSRRRGSDPRARPRRRRPAVHPPHRPGTSGPRRIAAVAGSGRIRRSHPERTRPRCTARPRGSRDRSHRGAAPTEGSGCRRGTERRPCLERRRASRVRTAHPRATRARNDPRCRSLPRCRGVRGHTRRRGR